MSWTTILLIGWPIASLISGPVIGRFVAARLENASEVTPASVMPSGAEVEAAPFGDSVLT